MVLCVVSAPTSPGGARGRGRRAARAHKTCHESEAACILSVPVGLTGVLRGEIVMCVASNLRRQEMVWGIPRIKEAAGDRGGLWRGVWFQMKPAPRASHSDPSSLYSGWRTTIGQVAIFFSSFSVDTACPGPGEKST